MQIKASFKRLKFLNAALDFKSLKQLIRAFFIDAYVYKYL